MVGRGPSRLGTEEIPSEVRISSKKQLSDYFKNQYTSPITFIFIIEVLASESSGVHSPSRPSAPLQSGGGGSTSWGDHY